MVDELYRFVHLRGVIPAEVDDNLLIRAWSDPPSELENELVSAADSGEDLAEVARRALGAVGEAGPFAALRQLNAALLGSVESVTVEGLRAGVRRFFDTDEVLDRARAIAQDVLLAAVLLPDLPAEERDLSHRLVVLGAVAQNVLRWPDEPEDDGEGSEDASADETLRRMLTLAVAVLPGRVSRLIGRGPTELRDERPLSRSSTPSLIGMERGDIRRVEAGADEFEALRRTALAELTALAVDPQVAPQILPAIESPPDEADPRLRPTAEMPVPRALVVLDDSTRETLSEATRTVLERAAPGQTDLLWIVDALERFPSKQPATASRASPINDPTGGFPVGSGALRPPRQGLVRPPGVGELLKVRRNHSAYRLGPITYIENVLAGETRERTHRRLDRTEELTFTETERTTVDERDLQATERFDLVNETTREVNAQTQLQVGAQVSGSYGTVTASASFGYTSSTATAESTRTATSNARETVDRAVKRIAERTLERRQRITIREVEETNRHELTNGTGGNRAGIYRFVDDEQNVGVYNYGTRLMVEAHVPEPGAYLRWIDSPSGDTAADPEPPRPPLPDGTELVSPSQLDPSNYAGIAGQYGAVVEPPPPLFRTVAIAGRQEYNQNTPDPSTPAYLFYRSEDRLQAPEGYLARRATGVMQASAWKFDVLIAVGAASFRDSTAGAAMPLVFNLQLADETGTIPVAFTINNAWGFAFTLEVLCQRSDRALERWQLQTFNAIMTAYEDRHSAWQDRQRAASISSAGTVTGTNPELNRQIERAELKKSITGLLSGSPLDRFGAVRETSPDGEPVPDDAAAVGQGAVIAFYEQAFEWEQTIYTLYPYFWGRHPTWPDAFSGEGVDSMHDAFLRAGVARVVIPVRPGFEQVALWFLSTGQIWNGGSPPPISGSDPLYVSIAAELIAADMADRGGVLQGTTWPVVTPTNLVYLQPDANLNPP